MNCLVCGAGFVAGTYNARYCSDACRRTVKVEGDRKYRAANLESVRKRGRIYRLNNRDRVLEKGRAYYAKRPKRPTKERTGVKCVVCANEFLTKRPDFDKYCSPECRRAFYHEYDRQKYYAKRELRREQNRLWRQANRERLREQHRHHWRVKAARLRESGQLRPIRFRVKLSARKCVNCGMELAKTPPSEVFVWPTLRMCSFECASERHSNNQHRWVEAHRARIRAYHYLTYEKQKDRLNELARLRYNPDKERERKRTYRLAHPEIVRERRRAYRVAHRDELREKHRKAHQELVAAVQVWRELVGPVSQSDGFKILRALKQLEREET